MNKQKVTGNVIGGFSFKRGVLVLLPYLVALFLFTVIINIVFKLNVIDIKKYPIAYFTGDGVSVIHRTHEMGTDHTLFLYNQLASPYGSSTYDYYTFDLLLLVIQYLFANITSNYVLAYNLFIFSAIYLNGFSAIYALRRLRFSRITATGLGIVYGILPFFFGRYRAHVYLTFYFVVPLAVVLAIEVFRGDFVFKLPFGRKYKESEEKERKKATKATLINAVIMIIIGMTGVYYALLSCMFIAFAAILRSLNMGRIRELIKPFAAVCISAVTFILSALPSILYWLKNGRTVVADMRTAQNAARVSEDMGLKLIQLFIPNKEHRFSLFSRIAMLYRDGTYTLGEWTESSYIGLVFACGLLLILLYIFILPLHNQKSVYTPLALFTIFILLVGSPSCMNFIFVKIFPYLRCYNRAVVYVAFMAAISTGYAFEYAVIHLTRHAPEALSLVLSLCLMSAVVVFAVWDQTGIVKDESAALVSQNSFIRDEEIVTLIMNEARQYEPADGKVDLFVMPYVRDEAISETFDHQRHTQLVVHDSDLRLSYGAPQNRPFDLELYDLFTNHTLDEQMDYAVNMGYDGVLVSPQDYIGKEEDPLYIETCGRLSERFGAPEVIAHDFIYWCIVN